MKPPIYRTIIFQSWFGEHWESGWKFYYCLLCPMRALFSLQYRVFSSLSPFVTVVNSPWMETNCCSIALLSFVCGDFNPIYLGCYWLTVWPHDWTFGRKSLIRIMSDYRCCGDFVFWRCKVCTINVYCYFLHGKIWSHWCRRKKNQVVVVVIFGNNNNSRDFKWNPSMLHGPEEAFD